MKHVVTLVFQDQTILLFFIFFFLLFFAIIKNRHKQYFISNLLFTKKKKEQLTGKKEIDEARKEEEGTRQNLHTRSRNRCVEQQLNAIFATNPRQKPSLLNSKTINWRVLRRKSIDTPRSVPLTTLSAASRQTTLLQVLNPSEMSTLLLIETTLQLL